ncbi:Mce family protein MceC [Nocardia nova SH22a]|uniref:Mce family protein MceC n=1 Tax=Nocardia nova SH22a TaxID=1415166 RepID=W5TKJ6_9NOCA|nr:MCE family protein [Nocardia nova]AHH19473.1 Mce family protein MceC [Nocardia nova SH22a]
MDVRTILRRGRNRLHRNRTRRTDRSPHPDRSLRLGVGSVALVAVVLGATVLIHSLHLGQHAYSAEFAQAAGVSRGDAVTDAGIPVGTVTGLRLAGDRVVVTMKIDRDVALGATTGAAIKLTTLLGSRYIELRPAGTGRLHGPIPLARTEVPYDLETALQQATTTFGQIDADKIARSMTTLSAQLRTTPALVPDLLDNVRTLSSIVASRRDQIQALLTSTAQVTTVIRAQQADLGALVEQGRSVLRQIIDQRGAVERMIAATTTLVHQLEPIAVGDRDDIQQLLTDLRAMTATIAGHDDLLRNILQILPVPWRLFANATGTGRELVGNAPDGAFIDTFMCALSARAEQVGRPPYLKDCR